MPLISTRKRVTPAGRGAHAIYLPKAWIDAWGEAQAATSEIDLVSLDEHLVLSPAIPAEPPPALLDDATPEALVRVLVSAYVTGHRSFTVRHPTGFSDQQIMEARRFLRLLDERLDVRWSDDAITFTRDPAAATRRTVTGYLADLSGKVEEAAESLAELLEYFPHNPARVLHAAHLIHAIEREDIQRIKNQAYRDVARLQVPAAHVADLQLLLLVTHTLARMGKLIAETACTISDHFGVPRDRLHYPPELLEGDLRAVPPAGAVFRGFLEEARRDLQRYIDLLAETRALCMGEPGPGGVPTLDAERALRLAKQAQEAHDVIAGRLMQRVAQAWGPAFIEEDPAAIYRVVKVDVHVQDLLEELRTLADRIVDFRLAIALARP